MIGPVNITKTNLVSDFELEVKIKDALGVEIPEKGPGNVPILYNMSDTPLKVDDLLDNGDVYIKIPQIWDQGYDLSEITIETTVTYFETKASLWVAAAEEQPILKVEKEKKVETDRITTKRITGDLILKINKTDKDGKLLGGASFRIIDETTGRTQIAVTDNGDGTFETPNMIINTEGQTFIFEIEEIKIPSGYVGLDKPFKIKITTKLSADGTKYIIDDVKIVDSTGAQVVVPGVQISSFVADTGVITITVQNDKSKEFDLALRKYITKINGKELTGADDRTPKIDTSKLNEVDASGNKITTAKYTHSKTPIVIKQGDIVTYKLRIYNEGELDGYAKEVADYIPEGLGYLMNHKTNTDNLWHPVADGSNQTMKLVGENGLYKNEADIKNLTTNDFFGLTSLSDVEILKGKSKIYSTALFRFKNIARHIHAHNRRHHQPSRPSAAVTQTVQSYYRGVKTLVHFYLVAVKFKLGTVQ